MLCVECYDIHLWNWSTHPEAHGGRLKGCSTSASTSFLLPPLHSYTSSTGLGSPCMGGSTGSIQPGMEKTGIFIENAASLFLLPETEQNYTPCGRRCWDWIKLKWMGDDKTAAQRPGAHFGSSNFKILSLTVSKCGFFSACVCSEYQYKAPCFMRPTTTVTLVGNHYHFNDYSFKPNYYRPRIYVEYNI